jgi:hypothetical protein
MANYEMIFFLYQKKKEGVRLLNFFDVKEFLVAARDSIRVCAPVSKRESAFTLNLKCASLFPYRIHLNISCMFIKCLSFFE